jgi:hypothetical protein
MTQASRIADTQALIDELNAGVGVDDCHNWQIIDAEAAMKKAAAELARLLDDNERLQNVIGEICTDSNPDWTEKRKYPNDVLDDIHTMAVDAYYHRRTSLTGDSQNER